MLAPIAWWLACLGNHTDQAILETGSQLAPADCELVVELSQRHHLTSFLYWRLNNQPDSFPVPIALKQILRQHYIMDTARSIPRDQELGRLLQTLNVAGIQPILFKGAAFAYTIYPNAALRVMGDIDLWIGAEHMPAAWRALEQLGYAQREKPDRPTTWQVTRQGEIQFFGTARGQGLVELHYGVFAGEWLHRVANINPADIRARIVPATIVGQPGWILEPTDALLQLVTHLAINHSMTEPVIRTCVDILLLAPQITDWDQVVARAREWRIATLAGLVLNLADTLLGLPAAQPAIKQLGANPLRRYALGWFVNQQTIFSKHSRKSTRLRFLLQLVLVDRGQDLARLLYRTLFPEAEWLTRRYGQATLQTRLAHLARALVGKI